MASEGATGGGRAGKEVNFSAAAFKIGRFSLLVGVAASVIAALIDEKLTVAFAAGYIIGFINVLWLVRIIRKGIGLNPEKAVGFVRRRYYIRFAVTLLTIAALIFKGILNPWSLIIGLSSSFFVTICAMIYVLRKEFSLNA